MSIALLDSRFMKTESFVYYKRWPQTTRSTSLIAKTKLPPSHWHRWGNYVMTKIMLTSFDLLPWDSDASHHKPNQSASSRWSYPLNFCNGLCYWCTKSALSFGKKCALFQRRAYLQSTMLIKSCRNSPLSWNFIGLSMWCQASTQEYIQLCRSVVKILVLHHGHRHRPTNILSKLLLCG